MTTFSFLSVLVSALDAVKGNFGKAAAGIAVGAGLLAAFPEAQAQTPTIREVTLTTPGPSLSTSFKIGIRLNWHGAPIWCVPLQGHSGICVIPYYHLRARFRNNRDLRESDVTYSTLSGFSSALDFTAYPSGGATYTVLMYPVGFLSRSWIHLSPDVHPGTGRVSDWVITSDGRFYSPRVSIRQDPGNSGVVSRENWKNR